MEEQVQIHCQDKRKGEGRTFTRKNVTMTQRMVTQHFIMSLRKKQKKVTVGSFAELRRDMGEKSEE